MEPWLEMMLLEVAETIGKDRVCVGKVRHAKEQNAINAVEDMTKKNKERHNDREVTHYPCPYCGGWHIGKKIPPLEMFKMINPNW